MKWRICMMLCISAFIISFPQNIIGCGPGIDPYDYYTSFFNPDISSTQSLRPFYYTGYNFLYDEEEPVKTETILANEWAAYCGVPVSDKDAQAFVTEYAQKDINSLYINIEKNQPLKIPDSVKRNSMTAYFMKQKDLEALGYILYAKKAQVYVIGGNNDWDAIKRDSLAMAKLIKGGLQLYAAAKTDLFKLKYAYQAERLAHYSGNYIDAIKVYDQYIAPNKTASVLQQLALALKAGAMWHTGQGKEAAYLFSKNFSDNPAKKISNYMSFKWAVDSKADRSEYLALCKTDKEKADMLSLFALSSIMDESATIQKIFALDPSNKNLETLAGREINKVEEFYFSPVLDKESGGKLFYYNWNDEAKDSTLQAGRKYTVSLTDAFVKMSKGKVNDPALFLTAAAYTSLMTKDFDKANKYLGDAKKMSLTPKVNDQWMLTNLLLSINESKAMDAQEEEKILPSVKWLQQKAKADAASKTGWTGSSQWQIFYRNIMSGPVAKKYHAQGNIYKEVLAIGAADKIYGDGNYNSVEFLHNKTDINDVLKLYALMTEKKGNNFENYLLANNAITVNSVIDFAGTSFLRNYDYANAINWLQRSKPDKNSVIEKNPFIDLLYDQEEQLSKTEKTDKLSFAKEMLRLQTTARTDKLNAPKLYYKTALGLYNMTYYGHAWELVQYYRSGSDGYSIPKDATEFQKQYYGCFAAQDMFKKAMDASTDRNFKARCLFMMAKCAQKNVRRPQYDDFSNDDYSKYDDAEKKYFPIFMGNKYFPQLAQEYNNTAFYKEAITSCSYLRDFVNKK